jgi:carbon monoxide dehydrogenase subunit G
MITHEVQARLDQPLEEVFDFLVDFRNEPAWNPECLSVEKTSDGPIAAGTTFEGRMKGVGKVDVKVVEFERLRHCATQSRGRGMDAAFDYRFEPNGGATVVTVAAQVRPRGPLRLLEPVLGRKMKQMLDTLPALMRQGVESAVR